MLIVTEGTAGVEGPAQKKEEEEGELCCQLGLLMLDKSKGQINRAHRDLWRSSTD